MRFPPTTASTYCAGMLLSHETGGTGPPVVLIHSTVCDSRMWDAQWADLTRHHQVIRCDLRGYGKTPLPQEPYSDAGDLRAVLEDLGITAATLVGASYGGKVALQIASAWPELVSRLALLSPLYDMTPTRSLRRFGDREDILLSGGDVEAATELNVATWLGPDADDDTRERVRQMQRRAFEVQIAAGDTITHQPGPQIDLARIDQPTLLISGEKDMDFFRRIAAHLAETLPRVRHTALPWAGHLPSLERPDTINELLRDFAAEGEGTAG